MHYTHIVYWNARGLTHKLQKLLQLILVRTIDIILTNKTYFASKYQFKLCNYFTYATNKHLVKGRPPADGTVILIYRRFIHQIENIKIHSIINVSIILNISNTKTRLVAVYKSPNKAFLTADPDFLLDSPYEHQLKRSRAT